MPRQTHVTDKDFVLGPIEQQTYLYQKGFFLQELEPYIEGKPRLVSDIISFNIS